MPAPHPRMHGLSHACGGPDPIPGICDILKSAGTTYQEQIEAQTSLLSYWPLDETSGNAIDHGPLGRNLTVGGTPTYGQPGALATGETSVLFNTPSDGTNPSIIDKYGDANDPGPPGPYDFDSHAHYTWIAFAYPTDRGYLFCPIFTNWIYPNGDTYGITLGILQDGRLVTYRASANLIGPVIPLNAWALLGVTYDGANLRLYVNGGLAATGASTGSHNSASPLHIGYIDDGVGAGHYRTFQGRICQIAVFDEALDGGTMLSFYTASSSVGDQPEGYVYSANGSGGTEWAAPTIEVEY